VPMDADFYRKKKSTPDLRASLKRLIRNRRLMLSLLIGAPIVLYVFFGPRGIVQRIRLESAKTELETKIREAEAETRRLQAESKALEGDKKAIEKVAREKYGMIREGETVYRVNKK
jgi:cell division protein FtsB